VISSVVNNIAKDVPFDVIFPETLPWPKDGSVCNHERQTWRCVWSVKNMLMFLHCGTKSDTFWGVTPVSVN
jgi:hypothetical protein